MSMRPGRPSSLDGIKRHAKAIKAEKGLQHARALDEAATLAGFQNFAHAKRALAAKGLRTQGRQNPNPPSSERPIAMSKREDFHTRARADWVRSISTVIGSPPASSTTWQRRSDIVNALSPIMGSNRNHALLPDGGGMDIDGIAVSQESGCLDLLLGRRTIYRVKPRNLVLEWIDSNPAESFFLLELNELGLSGAYPEDEEDEGRTRRLAMEEYVETGDGEVYGRSAWDDNETPDGRPLPDDAKLVVRLLRGKVLFVTKGSIWNGNPGTYDGRHSNMTSARIREIIESVIARRSAP